MVWLTARKVLGSSDHLKWTITNINSVLKAFKRENIHSGDGITEEFSKTQEQYYGKHYKFIDDPDIGHGKPSIMNTLKTILDLIDDNVI